MNEFKQRIAEALAIFDARPWQSISNWDKKRYIDRVDFILDAMVEPTGKMVDEGACAADLSGFSIGNDVALECWRLMITEAKRAD